MITVNEIDVKGILTKTKIPAADYVINPYVGCPHKCIYCYAEYMKRFTNHHESWGDFIDVKQYNKKINIKRLKDMTVNFSSVTDAYNPFEKKFNKTRELLKQFIGSEVKIEILTKSDLVIRDIDIFKKIPHIRIGISMNTLDDAVRKITEPRASSIEKRLNALKTLHEQKIKTWVFISPMFPGITDFKAIIQKCKPYTDAFYFENLNLRGAYRARVMKYIADHHAGLLPLYKEIYQHGDIGYWQEMEQEIHKFCRKNKLNYGSYFYHEKIKKR
jgi:DNA repair photolyase